MVIGLSQEIPHPVFGSFGAEQLQPAIEPDRGEGEEFALEFRTHRTVREAGNWRDNFPGDERIDFLRRWLERFRADRWCLDTHHRNIFHTSGRGRSLFRFRRQPRTRRHRSDEDLRKIDRSASAASQLCSLASHERRQLLHEKS